MSYRLQDEPAPSWAEGLPLDVLALVAGGTCEMKAMRGVCSSWQQGFERSVSKIKITQDGALFPADGSFSQRFSGLVSLDLGESLIEEADLSSLAGLKGLQTLSMGKVFYSMKIAPHVRLSDRLTGVGFQHLGGLTRLRSLSLRYCENLVDGSFECLRGLPLTDLDLTKCSGLTGSGLRFLSGMPLVRVNLEDCSNLETVKGLQNMPLVDLSLLHCSKLETLEGLKNVPVATLDLRGCKCLTSIESLRRMPLTSLDLRVCQKLNDSDLCHIQGLPLTFLGLAGSDLFTNGIFESLRGMAISSLIIGGKAQLGEESLQILAELGLPITDLMLGGRDFVWEGLRHIARMPIKKLSCLACPPHTPGALRHTWGMPLEDVTFEAGSYLDDNALLFLGCRGWRTLRKLIISDCSFLTNLGLKYLRRAPLTSLDLSDFNNLTDAGLEFLKGMPLTRLYLSGCPLLTDGCVDVLLSFSQLKDMCLLMCNGVSEFAIDELVNRNGVVVKRKYEQTWTCVV